MKKNVNKKSGFSMLELVVVMLIMGTLSSVRISKIGGSDKGRIKSRIKSDLRNNLRVINSCFSSTLDYSKCDTIDEIEDEGLKMVSTFDETNIIMTPFPSTDRITTSMPSFQMQYIEDNLKYECKYSSLSQNHICFEDGDIDEDGDVLSVGSRTR